MEELVLFKARQLQSACAATHMCNTRAQARGLELKAVRYNEHKSVRASNKKENTKGNKRQGAYRLKGK